jgi:hypothetical protein
MDAFDIKRIDSSKMSVLEGLAGGPLQRAKQSSCLSVAELVCSGGWSETAFKEIYVHSSGGTINRPNKRGSKKFIPPAWL